MHDYEPVTDVEWLDELALIMDRLHLRYPRTADYIDVGRSTLRHALDTRRLPEWQSARMKIINWVRLNRKASDRSDIRICA